MRLSFVVVVVFRRRERPRVPSSHEYEVYMCVCARVWVPWTPRDMAPRCSAFLLPPSARRGTTSCDHQRIHQRILRCTDRVDRNLMEWPRESSSCACNVARGRRIFVAEGEEAKACRFWVVVLYNTSRSIARNRYHRYFLSSFRFGSFLLRKI